jgi:hypothetical protein
MTDLDFENFSEYKYFKKSLLDARYYLGYYEGKYGGKSRTKDFSNLYYYWFVYYCKIKIKINSDTIGIDDVTVGYNNSPFELNVDFVYDKCEFNKNKVELVENTVEEYFPGINKHNSISMCEFNKSKNCNVERLKICINFDGKNICSYCMEEIKKQLPIKTNGFVYLVGNHEEKKYKIGVSLNPQKRESQIKTELPFKIFPIHKIRCEEPYKSEKILHEKFSNKRLNGEWFELDKSDIDFICAILGENEILDKKEPA